MNIKPILFNTEMVRATLEDRKTATRRVVKPQPQGRLIPELPGGCWPGYFSEEGTPRVVRPPYFPGDVLYVREAWTTLLGSYLYRANQKPGMKNPGKWCPSIHMPREAARIFLRVTDVRVERLHEITIEGMRMEGVTRRGLPGGCTCAWKTENCMREPCPNRDAYEYECWMLPFIEVWDSTIRPGLRALYGWGGNPWVWVIEYERCEKPEAVS